MDIETNVGGVAIESTQLLGYKIVSARSEGELETKVNNCIKAGFVPLGSPIATGQYRGTLIQAMIHQPNAPADQTATAGMVRRDVGCKEVISDKR